MAFKLDDSRESELSVLINNAIRYSHDYVVQEDEAMTTIRGIHAHECQPAWEWRAKHRN